MAAAYQPGPPLWQGVHALSWQAGRHEAQRLSRVISQPKLAAVQFPGALAFPGKALFLWNPYPCFMAAVRLYPSG